MRDKDYMINSEEIYEMIAPGADVDSLSFEERKELIKKADEELAKIIKNIEKSLGHTILI